MMETDDSWAEARWVERDATGRTKSGVRAAIRYEERTPPITIPLRHEEDVETWIGYVFRKLSRYVAPRQV